MTTVHLRRATLGLLTLAPDDAPLVIDAGPALDTLVLEVAGGHLSWSLLAGQEFPAAVLDDPDSAQDWLWAVYGEPVALAVADSYPQELTATPARPELATALRQLAYAHWATRWWPASTLDAIPTLDPRLLNDEITTLAEACEMALGDAESAERQGLSDNRNAMIDPPQRSADPKTPRESNGTEHQRWPIRPGAGGPGGGADPHDGPGSEQIASEQRSRAEDYALAAGGAGATGGGLVLARGSSGWDWRRCPPGIVDASEHAVSWQVTRASGVSTVQVSAVTAPDCAREVPEYLRPYAQVVGSPAADSGGGSERYTVPLQRRGDAWVGSVQAPGAVETGYEISVFVPGVGPENPPGDESPMRERIRAYVRQRLAGTGDDRLLTAEASAAGEDQDF
ncbi:hypothetical protein ACFVVM_17455 [Nocardia sp. NPDC058176]|uniref:hypothetical protein n=1 Tax=Nocardia sp. NPDC058176 TaxID=3346368 RepID=UPI0036D8B035